MLVSGGKSPPPFASQLAILLVHLALYRSRATVAAFRVPQSPHRTRRVAAMDHIAARAARAWSPAVAVRGLLSSQEQIHLGYEVFLAWSSCFGRERGLERVRYLCDSALHPFRRLAQCGRSRTPSSRSYVPRASANDAFVLVCASRQAHWPELTLNMPAHLF